MAAEPRPRQAWSASRPPSRRRTAIGLLTTGAMVAIHGLTAATVDLQPPYLTVFADRQAMRTVTVSGLAGDGGRTTVSWSLRTVAGARTLSAGSSEHGGTGTAAKVTVRWPVPEVRDGASVALRFAVVVQQEGHPSQAEEWKIVALPEDAFQDWPATAPHLYLYDPEGTATHLSTAGGPPLLAVDAPARLLRRPPAVLLTAPGVAPDGQDLAAHLWILVAAGWRVILLEPAAGHVALPAEPNLRCRDIRLTDAGLLDGGDEHLRNAGMPPVAGLTLGLRHGGPALVTADPSATASWADFRLADGDGRLLVCALPVVSTWDAAPWGRYVLRTMLRDIISEPNRTGGAP